MKVYNNKASETYKQAAEYITFRGQVPPVTERVRTFESACDALGVKRPHTDRAYIKLRIVTDALNEGWKPTFSHKEKMAIPTFRLYTEKELENVSLECAIDTQYGKFAFVHSRIDYNEEFTSPALNFPFRYKTEELATHSGTQFIKLWAELLLGDLYVSKPDTPLRKCPITRNRIVNDITFALRLQAFLNEVTVSDSMSDEELEYLRSVADNLVEWQRKTASDPEEMKYLRNNGINTEIV